MKLSVIFWVLAALAWSCDEAGDGGEGDQDQVCDEIYIKSCFDDLDDCYEECQVIDPGMEDEWLECLSSNCEPSMCDCLDDRSCDQPESFHFDCDAVW
jgi:hypothetical protein